MPPRLARNTPVRRPSSLIRTCRFAKFQRAIHGQRSERSIRLLDQMELQLEELQASATEDELRAEQEAARATRVGAFIRKRPARQPFPEHLPRERVVEPAPVACMCCGGNRLRKLGEDMTETLEVIPRRWKVIQHVREKFTCRDCEKISQAPAPFHVTPRGWAGPSLLAMLVFGKFGQHQPLNRQAERYAREGVPLSLSTLADQVGACCAVLAPPLTRLQAHVFAAERLHGDDTTVPVLARGKTDTGRCWVYVRDDRRFGGDAAPAAMFYYSRDRSGEHPQGHLTNYAGLFQADAYGGHGKLYEPDRKPGRTNSHLYEIRARDVGWGMVDPDWGDGPLDATKSRPVDVLQDVGVHNAEISLRLRRRLGTLRPHRTRHRRGARDEIPMPG
jgi:transposase